MAFDEDQKICGSITAGGLVTLLISGAMIVIGCLNLDFDEEDPVEAGDCRAEPMIPLFLIIAGIAFILLLVGRFVFQVKNV